MANYATEHIRTVALVGQGACGKTTLAEALLFKSGALAAAGSVERGTTVSDPGCRTAAGTSGTRGGSAAWWPRAAPA